MKTNKFGILAGAILLSLSGLSHAAVVETIGGFENCNPDEDTDCRPIRIGYETDGPGIALGHWARAGGAQGISVGLNSWSVNSGIAVGNEAEARSFMGTAIGNHAVAGVIGSTAHSQVAIGNYAEAAPQHSIAIGFGSRAPVGGGSLWGGYLGVVVGSNSSVLSPYSVVLGSGAYTHPAADNSVALGYRSYANEPNTVSVGRSGSWVGHTDANHGHHSAIHLPRTDFQRRIVNVDFGQGTYDAVIYQQVVPALTGIVEGLGGGATYDPTTGVMTAPSYALNVGTFDNVGDALLAIEGAVGGGGGTDPLAMTYDDTGKSTATLAGEDGTQVKNVADGTDPMDAVNKRQLDLVDGRVSDTRSALSQSMTYIGDGASYDPATGVMTGPTINLLDGSTHTTITSSIHNIDGRLTHLEQNPGGGPAGADGASAYEVAVNNGFTGSETEWLESLHGRDGIDGQNGVDGRDGADGIDGQQGEKGDKGDQGEQGPAGPPGSGDGGQDGADGRDGIDGQDGRDGVDGQDGADGLPGEKGDKGDAGQNGIDGLDGRSAYELAVEDGFEGSQADWLESLHGRDGVDGVGGGTTVKPGSNIEVVDNDDNSQSVYLSDNVELTENGSVSVGTTRMDAQGIHIQGGPSMTRNGIDAGNRRITSVAPGRIEQGSTDAINGGQVWEIKREMDDRWQDTNRQIERVGAQSAALSMMNGAATYLPVGKVALNAGWGQYGNQSAFAVGAKARLSERSSLAIGFSYSGGKAMGGVGYSLIID